MPGETNQRLTERLREAADLLEGQGANPFRVGAYRRAAETLVGLERDAADILEREGLNGLIALPNVGRSIAAAIEELIRTGRWAQLERLRGTLDPEHLFQAVPGIGPELARRIHDTLEIETLEGLEVAAHDGRLEQVPKIGARRAAMIRAALALGEITGAAGYLAAAEGWAEVLDRHYWDGDGGGYFFTADDAEALIVRAKQERPRRSVRRIIRILERARRVAEATARGAASAGERDRAAQDVTEFMDWAVSAALDRAEMLRSRIQ